MYAIRSYYEMALTDTGDEVILYSDGTWAYTNKGQGEKQEIPTNPQQFFKPSGSKFLLKSTKNSTACWLNTSLWTFQKSDSNTVAEYEFELKGEDLYGMVINEGLSMPIATLAKIALDNAKEAAPNARILSYNFV